MEFAISNTLKLLLVGVVWFKVELLIVICELFFALNIVFVPKPVFLSEDNVILLPSRNNSELFRYN